jgi:hypothetical protein
VLVLFFTTLAAVIALIGYGALDLGGSFTAVIFLTVFFAGAVVRSLRGVGTI